MYVFGVVCSSCTGSCDYKALSERASLVCLGNNSKVTDIAQTQQATGRTFREEGGEAARGPVLKGTLGDCEDGSQLWVLSQAELPGIQGCPAEGSVRLKTCISAQKGYFLIAHRPRHATLKKFGVL